MRRVFGVVTRSLVIVALCAVAGVGPSAGAAVAQGLSPATGASAQATQTPPAGVTPPAGRGQPPARDNNNAPQTGTARIRGRVTTVDGVPLRRAQVQLTGISEPRAVAADDQGRYEIRNLPAGRFTLTASKTGYLTLSHGQRRPLEAPRPVEVANAQLLDGIDFSLPKGAVIAVRVTGERGDPLPGVEVHVEQYRFSQGQRTLTRAASSVYSLAVTNDLGELRVHGLAPGDYYVSAVLRLNIPVIGADRRLTYLPTYYPATASEGEAQPVRLSVGEETSIAIPLVISRAAQITGTIRRPDGSPLGRSGMSLAQLSATGISSRGFTAQPDGTFSIANVMPGRYFIQMPVSANEPLEYASMPITVAGEDITGLVVTTMRAAEVSGQIIFDTGAPSGLGPASLIFTATNTLSSVVSSGRWTVNPDWTFRVTGLTGSSVFKLGAQTGWFVKAITLAGRDVTDTPFDFDTTKEVRDLRVTLTQKRTEVSGSVLDDHDKPVTEFAVVVFAEDRARWTPQSRFIAAGAPDQQGRFKITGLPAGRYLASAVEYLETGSERDPDLLGRLERNATPVTLDEGAARAVTLRVQ